MIVKTPVDLPQETTGSHGLARSVIVKLGGKLTIDPKSSLTIQNYLKNEAAASDVLVESDANLIQINDSSVNIGNITVKRNANLKRLDYNYWGAPVSGQNVRSFSPETLNTRFYFYNESNDYFDGIFVSNKYPTGTYSLTPVQNASTYNFEIAKGYAIRSSNNYTSAITTFAGNFVGVPNNGINSYALAFTDANHGHNLIANPYPSNLDFDALYSNNSALIYNTIYFWTNVNPNPSMQSNQYPKVGSINNYAVYSGTGGLSAPYGFDPSRPAAPTPNNVIKVGQGFVVKAKSAGNLNFQNSFRTKTAGTFFNRMANTTSKDRYWLELKTPLNFVTPMLIGYVNGATDLYEFDFDVPLLIQGADTFYSVLEDKKLAIQGRKFPLNQEDAVALGAVFYDNGLHTISLANKEGVFANGQSIYLHDKKEELYINLQKDSYTFSAEKGESTDRFEIVYNTANRILGTNEINKYGLLIYEADNHFVIKADEIFDQVKIYDFSGKLLKTIEAGKKQIWVEKSILNTGTNIFSIIFADEIINKKIISK